MSISEKMRQIIPSVNKLAANIFKDPTIEVAFTSIVRKGGEEIQLPPNQLPGILRGDGIKGHIKITPDKSNSIKHKGILLNLIGEFRDPASNKCLLSALSRQTTIFPGGTSEGILEKDFFMSDIVSPYPTFYGVSICYVCVISVKIIRSMKDVVSERHIAYFEPISFSTLQNRTSVTKMTIGNSLEVDFIFPSLYIPSSGVILGCAYFNICTLMIEKVTIVLRAIEKFAHNSDSIKERYEIARWELLDGAIVRGDRVPIRIFLGQFNLFPVPDSDKNPLHVEYYLRIILLDQDGSTYLQRLEPKIVMMSR